MTLEQKIQLLMDEREIRNVIYRDCRAKSRGDRELMRACFFEGAVDHHQPFFDGPIDPIIDGLEDSRRAMGEMVQYVALQILVDVFGDVARTESYVQTAKIFHQRLDDGRKIIQLGGKRFLDRLERRNGEWRIAERQFVPEWGLFSDTPDHPTSVPGFLEGGEIDRIVSGSMPIVWPHAPDRSDPSYSTTYNWMSDAGGEEQLGHLA